MTQCYSGGRLAGKHSFLLTAALDGASEVDNANEFEEYAAVWHDGIQKFEGHG
jgi:hypothetical protein